MKTKTADFQSWDDLVFEHRNQAYGAYPIRKRYSNSVIIGFGLTVAFAALLLTMPRWLREKAPVIADAVLEDERVIRLVDVPPVERNVQPPRRLERTTPVTRTSTSIVVVTDPVQETVATETVIDYPETDASHVSGEGVAEGTGTVIAEPLPVVDAGPRSYAEVMPEYEGGMEGIMRFIKKKLHYPASARRQGIEGTVFVSFVVNGDGSVSDATVLRGIHRECDEEARRVIAMLPHWKGGKQGGLPVRVKMVLPIKFSLQ